MAINVPAVIELIAHRPKIRTVEIADIIDCEPDQVEPALQKWINAGDIIMHPVTAPNGRPANGFECTEKFRKSELHGIIMARAKPAVCENVQTGQKSKLTEVLEGALAKTDAVIPASTKRCGQIGIDCIKANGGRATDEQIRAALKLKARQYPSSWMALEVRRGEVHKDGEYWKLGPKPAVSESNTCRVEGQPAPLVPIYGAGGTANGGIGETPGPGNAETPQITRPSSHPAASEKAETPETLPAGNGKTGSGDALERAMMEDGIIKMAEPVPQEAEPIAPAMLELDPVNLARPCPAKREFALGSPAPETSTMTVRDPERFTEFACAKWSTGTLQLRRMGQDIAFLTPDEVDHIARFLELVPA